MRKIGAIYKTRCPGVYQCKDGTFTDSNSRRACSWHGGLMLAVEELSAVEPVTPKPRKQQLIKERKETILPDAQANTAQTRCIKKRNILCAQLDVKHREMYNDAINSNLYEQPPGGFNPNTAKIYSKKQYLAYLLHQINDGILHLVGTNQNENKGLENHLQNKIAEAQKLLLELKGQSEPINQPTRKRSKNIQIGPATLPDYDPEPIVTTIAPAVVEERKEVILPEPEPEPEPEQEPPQNYWIVNSDNKAELHFDFNTYKNLPQTQKSEIKKYFLWGKQRKAWVSKGDFRTYGAQSVIKLLNLPLYKKEERKTFSEKIEHQSEHAENRADLYATRAQAAEKRGFALQSDFNRLRKDWAWITQPNVPTAGGRRFRNHRDKVMARYEKGFEEYGKADHYREKIKDAELLMTRPEFKNLGFIARRIKETQKSLKNIYNNANRLLKLIDDHKAGKKLISFSTKKEILLDDLLDEFDNVTRDIDFLQTKLLFYEAKKEEIESDLPLVPSKSTLKGATFINKGGLWHKVIRLNPTTVTHTDWEGMLADPQKFWERKTPYSEIKDVSFDNEDNFIFSKGGYIYEPKNKIGHIYRRIGNLYTDNIPININNTALTTAVSLLYQPDWKRFFYKTLRQTNNQELSLYIVYYLYNRRKTNNIPAQYINQIFTFIQQNNL